VGVQKGVLETMGPSPKMAEHEITFSVGPKLRGEACADFLWNNMEYPSPSSKVMWGH
jgi:hypothetical protein